MAVNKAKMEQCKGCGAFFASKVFIKNVGKRVGVFEKISERRLCPTCKRVAGAFGITGMEPDYRHAEASETSPE